MVMAEISPPLTENQRQIYLDAIVITHFDDMTAIAAGISTTTCHINNVISLMWIHSQQWGVSKLRLSFELIS